MAAFSLYFLLLRLWLEIAQLINSPPPGGALFSVLVSAICIYAHKTSGKFDVDKR